MNSSYICNCGCKLVFTVQSNVRGCLIRLTPDSYILEDRIVGDRWANHIGHLRIWGELKNKIISKTQHLINNNNNNNIHSNNPNVWVHLYNQYINRNGFENFQHETMLEFVNIQ